MINRVTFRSRSQLIFQTEREYQQRRETTVNKKNIATFKTILKLTFLMEQYGFGFEQAICCSLLRFFRDS